MTPTPIHHVLATVAYRGPHRQRLISAFEPAVVEFVDPDKPEAMQQALARADVAVLRGDLDARFLAAPALRWVHCDHAGLERSARSAVFERGLLISGAAGRSAPALAEHAMLFMLTLAYDLPAFLVAQRRRQWGTPGMAGLRGLYGQTVGIVGLGNTGSAIAERASAFGMRVLAYRRRATTRPKGVEALYCADHGDTLAPLLRDVDFLVLAASLNNATHGMIGAPELAQMKPSSRLINIARGALVDERALTHALHAGRLAGAGLDTFATEPLPRGDPLWRAPNLVITPHVTPQVPDRTGRSLAILEKNIARYRSGRPLINALTPEDRYDPPS